MAQLMMPRLVWFVAGSVAGIYGAAKARRAAYRLSVPGLADQASALGQGLRAFSAEMQDGMQAREHDIARQLLADPEITSLSLPQSHLDGAPSNKKAT